MKNLKEMTVNEVRDIVDLVDFDALHREMTLAQAGQKAWIFSDGSYSFHGQGTIPNPANDTVLCVLPVGGIGNLDASYFADGWCEQDDNGEWDEQAGQHRHFATDREMIEVCLHEGDFADDLEELATLIDENAENYLQQRRDK